MKRILFVCTGNTCRSPMAEGFLRFLLEKEPALSSRYYAASAGISALGGDTASREAAGAMKTDWGIDISGHCSTVLSKEHIEDSFLILTMTRSHRDNILSYYPGAADKTFTLTEYTGEKKSDPSMAQYDYSLDIPDPYGRPLRYYRQCADAIRQAVERLVEKLKKSL